jgi:hypothetical protein
MALLRRPPTKDGIQGGGPGGGGSLDHAILASPEVESRAMLGLAGRISVTHKVASGGNSRSSDQSIMALCAISFVETSARSLLVVIDICSLVRDPVKTLDPGIPRRMMAARGVVLLLVGVIFRS